MTAVAEAKAAAFDFVLDPEHEAHEPPEARGLRRDGVRLLVSRGQTDPIDARFSQLADFLDPGDLLVVNTTATIPAALDGRLPSGEPVVVHLSGRLPGHVSLVEVRQPAAGSTAPLRLDRPASVELLAGGRVELLTPFADSTRLWVARLELPVGLHDHLRAHGRPVRYRHVPGEWPLSAYQTVFSRHPGSAEMASASRPFTPEVVTELATRGVLIVPLLLHTGVSSLEGHERPYPERYQVPGPTATTVNSVRARGGRVVAAGTTVVRAIATVTDEHGVVHPGEGWTETVITPDTPVRSLDGLLTGWHEPESSHLWMLEAFAEPGTLDVAYRRALDAGYLWHEFGDSHLLLRDVRDVREHW